MPKFRAQIHVNRVHYVELEAVDQKEAEEKANQVSITCEIPDSSYEEVIAVEQISS